LGEVSDEYEPRGDELVADAFDFGGKRVLFVGGMGDTARDLRVLAVRGTLSFGAGELMREDAAEDMDDSLSRTCPSISKEPYLKIEDSPCGSCPQDS
jgi:hypothetical protein